MIRYRGLRLARGCRVWILCDTGPLRPLPLRLDLANHSPDGFEWGYGGSGPAQLALALLAHATGDDQCAITLYQEYKARVLAVIDRDAWDITQADVCAWATAHAANGAIYSPGTIIV